MEETVNVARKNLVLAAGALLVAGAVHAASIVPPENLGELAQSSDAGVLAVAGPSDEAPGGELDGFGWFVPGSPRFEPGHVYLLFLSEKPTGEWVPRMMAYGLLHR